MNTRPTRRRRRCAVLGLLLAVGATLTACSGDDDATDATGAPTVVSQTVAVDPSTTIAAPPTTLPLGDPST
ncbi:MAG: hypothetical protein RLZZ362_2137, partial [Actinomycetota bacterium]